MRVLAWIGAVFVALIGLGVATAASDYVYLSKWPFLAGPFNALYLSLAVWILFLLLYPIWRVVRAKAVDRTPFQLLGLSMQIAGAFFGIGGVVVFSVEAWVLGGALGVLGAMVFFPVGVLAVAILGNGAAYLPALVVATGATYVGSRLGGRQES